MTIEHERTGKTTVTLILNGRLDTANAPLLEQKIRQWGEDIRELILDFAQLDYISSMGLRVLLQAKKELKQEGRSLVIKNMGESVREVFEMTGFLKLMVQEEKFVVIRKNEPADKGSATIILSLNGEMHNENVETLSKELSEIKEENHSSSKAVQVILDMEKLSAISSSAIKLLKQAITETDWEARNIRAKNAAVDMQTALEEGSLRDIL
ncbi:MAG: anti-sigma factor antagonist [Treponema sp.]|nr:anti-sigma factor antagonist [Treponema sp.]